MKTFSSIVLSFLLNLSVIGQSASFGSLQQNFISLEHPHNTEASFNEAFSQVRIVGLGEATHGTSEFFRIKTEFIKYLVEREGFNTVIFEGSFYNSVSINEYITEGRGNVYQAIIALGPWCWYTKEILDLVEWLKTYNSQKASADKVRFYGCDMQILKFTTDALTGYLSDKGMLTNEWESELEKAKKLSTNRKLDKAQSQLLKTLSDDLKQLFAHQEMENTKADRIGRHNLRILEQWLGRTSASKNQLQMRDQFMAENIDFILSLEENSKAVVWAHNTHIAKNKDIHQKLVPMGFHLASTHGEQYYAIGFGFNSGTFNAINGKERTVTVGDADEDSSDFQFSKSDLPSFFLNMRNSEINHPLIHEKTISRNIGQNYYPKSAYRHHIIAESYDGVVFVRETKASELLDFNLIR